MNTKAVALALGLYFAYTYFSRPKWLDDLLLRTYGADHLANGRIDPVAASVASEYGLPVTWVMELRNQGADDTNLSAHADAVIGRILKLGPPANTLQDTLIAYKAQVLSVTPRNP